VDLHCHSSASFDSLSSPRAIVRAAVQRGLTHIAITDHERIDGAMRARDLAPDGLTVIIGEEIRTARGDMVGLFLTETVPPGMSPIDTAKAIHEQGGLAGLPHPFDRFRGSTGRAVGAEAAGDDALEELAKHLDYVEAYNSRVPYPAANQRAADFAKAQALPGVAVSDAHVLMEVGVAYNILTTSVPITDAASLRSALLQTQLVMGRASWVARTLMPAIKVIQRLRGNRRIRAVLPAVTPTERPAEPGPRP